MSDPTHLPSHSAVTGDGAPFPSVPIAPRANPTEVRPPAVKPVPSPSAVAPQPTASPQPTTSDLPPFSGVVHQLAPSTIDPPSALRVWREAVDAIGEAKVAILDASPIVEMNRRSISAMVQCFKRLDDRGVTYCLSGLQRQVEAMLELLGVLHLVETFPSVEEAQTHYRQQG